MRRLKRLLLPALILASVASACTRPAPAPGPAPTPLPPAPKPDGGPTRVRYSAPWGGLDIRLMGVDPQQNHAWIWKADRRRGHRALELVQIDLGSGRRLQRWQAQPDKARHILNGYPTLRAWSDDLAADAARMAGVVRQTGPWSSRARPVPPALAWSQAHEVIIHEGSPTHGGDGDWLFTRDAQGAPLGRLDLGMRASYSPAPSPDGEAVAWRACSPAYAGRGKNCGYVLATAPLTATRPSAAPTLHGDVPNPTAPVWSPQGDAVLAVARPRGRACLMRAAPDKPGQAQELHCRPGARDPAFSQTPSGDQGVLVTTEGDPQRPSLRWDWLELPQGKLLGTWSEPQAAGAGLWLDDRTLAWLQKDGSLVLLRPGSQRRATLAAGRGRFAGLSMTQLTQEGHLVLLRLHRRGFDVVSIDTEAVLAAPTEGL